MARQARLDAPGTPHHGMVRGSERTAIVRAAADRRACLARLAAQAEQGAWTVSAGALLPHHAHRLVRTGTRSLGRAMRSLLTGDTGTVNRYHHRGGPLFQNRSKSIGVEEEPHRREVVPDLH